MGYPPCLCPGPAHAARIARTIVICGFFYPIYYVCFFNKLLVKMLCVIALYNERKKKAIKRHGQNNDAGYYIFIYVFLSIKFKICNSFNLMLTSII